MSILKKFFAVLLGAALLILLSAGINGDFLLAQPAHAYEDCLPFETYDLRIEPDGSKWLLTDGYSRMLIFDSQQEANRSLDVIQYYGMNDHCFVGRPDPSFQYWLVSHRSPQGYIAQEDCIPFDPSAITVTQIGGRWTIVEGGYHLMFDFDGKESEARQALEIIRKYGFTYTCFVGRPNPEFQYLRR